MTTTHDAAVYRTLLESTKAIPWRIDWATMQFTYIGPQIEELLGWTPSSWVSVNDWAERIHVEDRQKTVDFCVAQSQQGVDHEADYRAVTRDGDYKWIRDVVHVVRRADGRAMPARITEKLRPVRGMLSARAYRSLSRKRSRSA